MKRLKARIVIRVAIVLALVAGAGITYLVAPQMFGSGHANSASTSGASDEGAQVATALKQLETDPKALIPAALAKDISGQMATAIPAGTKIKGMQKTWQPDGTGAGGTMTVNLTSKTGQVDEFLAVMVLEKDGWKVLSTFGVTGSK